MRISPFKTHQSMNPYTLKFRGELERSFMSYYFHRSKVHLRYLIAVTFLLYSCFGFLDAYLFPAETFSLYFLRFGIYLPVSIVVFILTFSDLFQKLWQEILSFWFFCTGLVIILMPFYLESPDRDLYYAGLMLVLSGGQSLLRTGFIYSLITGTSIWIIYVLSALYGYSTDTKTIISNASFLFSMNILGIYTTYTLEYYIRQEFVSQRMYEKQKEETDLINQELENRVRQRTIELEIAKTKAEKADRLKSAFLANMSHEIRTPLNSILGFSNLLNDTLENEEEREFAGIIIKQSNELLNLVNDIVDISKIEAEEIPLQKDKIVFKEFIQNIYHDFMVKQDKLMKKNLMFRLKLPDSEWDNLKIISDQYRLRQSVANVLDNAFKFTEEGFIELSYDIIEDTTEDGHFGGQTYISVAIQDSGIGISPELLPNIYDRFVRTDDFTIKHYRGAGLGLTITKQILDLMHCQISAVSKVNEGSTFRIDIPLQS